MIICKSEVCKKKVVGGIMKKKNLSILVVCLMCLFIPSVVSAHPGNTDGSGCHKCNTNCTKWGLNTGEYHCHNGNNYTNSRGQAFNSNGSLISGGSSSNTNSNNQIPTLKPNPKSSDNTLRLVTIDGDNIEVSDKMSYKTKKEKIEILVETNDNKATYNISNSSLSVGKNTIDINVTAENGDVKNYSLVVDREKLSNNTNIKISVDDEEVDFILRKADINVSSDTKNLNYKYELEDKNSQVKVDGNKDLKFGKNIVFFTVTAEDGTEVKYELTVNKYTKADEIMGVILGLATMGGIGYGIYYFIKKRKRK